MLEEYFITALDALIGECCIASLSPAPTRRVGTICPSSDVVSCQALPEQPATSTRDKRAPGTLARASKRPATEKVANEHIARLPVCVSAACENAGAGQVAVRWTEPPGASPRTEPARLTSSHSSSVNADNVAHTKKT